MISDRRRVSVRNNNIYIVILVAYSIHNYRLIGFEHKCNVPSTITVHTDKQAVTGNV